MLGSTRPEYAGLEWVMKPMGTCQACLSTSPNVKDYFLTCDLCRSCIHSKDYGHENNLEEPWKCQRCRYLLQHGSDTSICCAFCPSLKGIMRQYQFENEKIWLHPECAVWGYPLISFTNNKRNAIQKAKPKNDADLFWCPDMGKLEGTCEVCHKSQGYLIKCKYHSCRKRYHVTCAISEGVVRDLESMKTQKNISSYFPVYCREHIELRMIDYRKRSEELMNKGETEKGAHFKKISYLFEVQLKNLDEAAEKYKKQEKVIEQLNSKAEKTINEGRSLNFSGMEESFDSYPQQYIEQIEQELIKQGIPLQPLSVLKKNMCQRQQMVEEESEIIQEDELFNCSVPEEPMMKSEEPKQHSQMNEEGNENEQQPSEKQQNEEFAYWNQDF